MPEKDRESIVSKATAMKKAGFHPVMIVVITVLSTPGIWQQFFDDTDEQALRAVEKAYPLLEQQVEQHAEAVKQQRVINEKLLVEITKLKTLVLMGGARPFTGDLFVEDDPLMGMGGGGGYGIGAGAALLPPEELFPAAGDGDSECDEEGAGEPSEASEEPPPAPPRPRTASEKSLDDLIQQQKEMPIRDKLPDLGELLGKK